MNENRDFSLDEVMDAIKSVTSQKMSRTGSDRLTESEVVQIADELGIDSHMLRSVLNKGTGSISREDHFSEGIGWPKKEEFIRVVSGEISEEAMNALGDELGAPLETPNLKGKRIMGEYWEGLLYVTLGLISRDGKTRVVARSQVSPSRLFPMMIIGFMFLFMTPLVMLKKAPDLAGLALVLACFLTFVTWLVLGVQMRKNRQNVIKKADKIAELVKSEVTSGNSYSHLSQETDISQNLKQTLTQKPD